MQSRKFGGNQVVVRRDVWQVSKTVSRRDWKLEVVVQSGIYVLMHDLGLNGPKFGCGLAQCGACTVLLDGEPIRSCTRKMSDAAGHEITTIEGLGMTEHPHPIHTAFIQEQAAQCAFCISGPMLYGKAYVDAHPNATGEEINQALNNLLCRCYAHTRMISALLRYAQGLARS